MPIVLLTAPNPTSPGSISDYQYQNAYLTAMLQAFTGRVLADGTTIRAGSVIKVADLLYKATTDTAITGAETPYIKITPAGASASASFVSSLTGVSWSHAHGQYLDVSGNAYFFDEVRARLAGEIDTTRTDAGWRGTGLSVLGANTSHGGVILTGSGSWTAPPGVTSVKVTIGGGGGGGGGGGNYTGGAGSGAGGGGGGAGGLSIGVVSVIPGVSYPYVNGGGGVGGAPQSSGGDGGDSSFGGLVGHGGSPGGGGVGMNPGTGGPGGVGGVGDGYFPIQGGNGGNGAGNNVKGVAGSANYHGMARVGIVGPGNGGLGGGSNASGSPGVSSHGILLEW